MKKVLWEELRRSEFEQAVKNDAIIIPTGSTEQHGVPFEIDDLWKLKPIPFDKHLIGLIKNSAEKMGYSTKPMVSGVGHDAGYLTDVGPTAMIFVPSIGGRSHAEAEETKMEDCEAGQTFFFIRSQSPHQRNKIELSLNELNWKMKRFKSKKIKKTTVDTDKIFVFQQNYSFFW